MSTNAAVTVADGAVLAGEFVIPFDKDETLNTFELQLMGKKKGTDTSFDTNDDKEYILQTWSVKLDDASIDATLKDTEYHYSIYVTTCTKSVSVAVATIPTNQALTRINHSRWINPKSW